MTEEAPGWAAIDAALARTYGSAEPQHWGTIIGWRLGGPDPLDGISAYRREEPVPHWHYVGYGMSALYENDDPTSELSGWGFEFTFRLLRGQEEQAPVWPASLLQNLARYVHQSGNWFEAGHHLNLNGPIAADRPDTRLTRAFFAEDPELGTIRTPHGTVQFLQIVGMTEDEHQAGQDWNVLGLLDVLLPWLPLLVTDLDRSSLLGDPLITRAVRDGIARDGSSTGVLFVDSMDWDQDGDTLRLTVGANAAPSLGRALTGRLPHGRDLTITNGAATIRITSAPTFHAEQDEQTLVVQLPDPVVAELRAVLRPERGRHSLTTAPRMSVTIQPTEIKDADGNPTGEIVG